MEKKGGIDRKVSKGGEKLMSLITLNSNINNINKLISELSTQKLVSVQGHYALGFIFR